MSIELAPHNPYGLAITNPVIAAAGCLGSGIQLSRTASIEQIGALVTPTTSLRGHRGRPLRLIETPAGLLCVGRWPGQSLTTVLQDYTPTWATWRTPVLLSVSGANAAEAAALATQLEGVEGIAGIELDLSDVGDQAATVVAAVRAVCLLPLLAKLPAREEGLIDMARSVVGGGADALVVAMPPLARWSDTGTMLEGRLCGPAWGPLALHLVALLAGTVDIPVIGAGGIASTTDAQRMLAAGASAVQVGSALLADPGLAATIGGELVNNG
jgi:dihydroorotate dehydrogenase (NAD+) catalytic subunit